MERTLSRGFALVALAFAALPSAMAQRYYRREIPDYDQRRDALPQNGSMYCVPTSYVDLLRFMARYGFSNLDKGYDGSYASITSFIRTMGNRMDTDPDPDGGGTNFSDGFDVVVDWIEDHSNQTFFHYAYASEDDWGLTNIKDWIVAGAMVRVGYGRYCKTTGGDWERDGGHAMAVAGYDFRPQDNLLLVANPANGDSDLNHQSTEGINGVHSFKVRFNSDEDGWVSHTRFGHWSGNNGNWMRIIDGMHVILPVWGGWVDAPKTTALAEGALWASIGLGSLAPAAKTTFHAVFPNALDDGKNAPVRELRVDLPGPVKEWCFDPKSPAIYVLGEDGTIHHVELVSKETKRIGAVKGAKGMAVAGRKLDLYVLKDDGADDALVRLEPRTGKQTSMKLAKGATAIEADPSTLGVAILHPAQKRLFRIAPELRNLRAESVELPEGKGAALLSLTRKGEASFTRSDAKEFVAVGARRIGMATAAPVRSFQAAGKARFLVQEGDRLRTVDADGKAATGAFDAVRPTGRFRIAQSWKAFTKADVTGKKWRDVPPEAD